MSTMSFVVSERKTGFEVLENLVSGGLSSLGPNAERQL